VEIRTLYLENNQTTILLAHVINLKNWEYIQIMQFRHAFANYTYASWELPRLLMITYDFKSEMTKESWAGTLGCFYYSLACGPLKGITVDVPPLIAVTCAPFGIAYHARIVGFLVAHEERDGASVADGHKSQSPQDGRN
jgi:hypothetical protein